MHDIKYLFEPRSVAVIGATDNPLKLGHVVIKNVVLSGYQGRIYPVNPKGGRILDVPVIKNVSEAGDGIDLAVIVIPASMVFDAVKSCADCGVKFAAIITSGFSEIGNTSEEKKIVEYARERGMRILGPNIVGIYSYPARLNATFGAVGVIDGTMALISQSGALAGAIAGKTLVENIGLSAMVAVGNKADIDESDLLDYLAESAQTRVIMMYVEGVTHGEHLVSVLKRVTRVKPVVALKSGKSRRGAMAAASHTGSLAGEDRVFDDIARQCGVIRAEGLDEALEWCKFLSVTPEPNGDNTVIITNGGGLGVMAADACEKYGINLYDDQADLKRIFSGIVPDIGSIKNPVDITGQAMVKDYTGCIGAAMGDEAIHSILCLGCETGIFDADAFAMAAGEQFKAGQYHKPILFSFVGGFQIEQSISKLRSINVPIFSDVLSATSCLGAVYCNHRNRIAPEYPVQEIAVDIKSIKQVVAAARRDGRRFLLAHEGQVVLKAIGVPGPKGGIAHNLDEAIGLAGSIGYPVVMKVVSPDIIHKSDAGGVALDIDNSEEVASAYEAILQNCRRYKADARIDGIEVSEQVRPGLETIVGARRDQSFGPIVMFGLGGIYVEVMKDIAFRAFPISRTEAGAMISQIKTYPLLLGVRGEKRKDIEAAADAIIRVGTALKQVNDISDIEINPLIAYEFGEGVKAVDVRILLTREQEA